MSATNLSTWGFILGAGAAAFLLGFVVFTASVLQSTDADPPRADGIVVLTGGQARIGVGARLFTAGLGQRMLITGVNRQTTREDVERLSRLPPQRFACCVDLDYLAHDTAENASQAAAWAKERGYLTLIVVTSAFHMPRSLAEFARAMPGVRLFPHPVISRGRNGPWWLDGPLLRNLVSEYVKYLPAAAKLALAQVSRPFADNSVAGRTLATRPNG